MSGNTYDINLISEETGVRIANATELIALAQNENAKGSLTWAGYGNILRKGLIADYAPVIPPVTVTLRLVSRSILRGVPTGA